MLGFFSKTKYFVPYSSLHSSQNQSPRKAVVHKALFPLIQIQEAKMHLKIKLDCSYAACILGLYISNWQEEMKHQLCCCCT